MRLGPGTPKLRRRKRKGEEEKEEEEEEKVLLYKLELMRRLDTIQQEQETGVHSSKSVW